MSEMSICGYLWASWLAIWWVWAFWSKPTQTRESFGSRIPYLVLTTAAAYVMFNRDDVAFGWLRLRILPRTPWIEHVGIAITGAGLLFAIWARACLGRNWSGTVTIKVGHQLVRSGPYRWVRHPIYSGIILALIGTAMVRGQVRGLIAVPVLWIGFLMKARAEERFMTATFGREYEEYSRTTGAIVPRLKF